jgi:RimJ/RimL family protein N-acetyltransferase
MEHRLSQDSLQLRPFRASDIVDFSSLHSDEEVMADLGGPIDEAAAEAKLNRYMAAFEKNDYGRWAVFDDAAFVGYVGVMHREGPQYALGAHDEIGWRIHRRFWGRGFVTRAAHLVLNDIFDRVGLPYVLAYTLPDNVRSQAVIKRLNMTRRPDMDFSEKYDPVGTWDGLVWQITADQWRAQS